MKVAVINQALGPFFTDIVNDLARKGHTVDVITGSETNFKNPNITVHQAPQLDRNSIYTRAITWLKFLLFVCYKLFNLDKKYLLFVSSNPPLLPHLAVIFAKLRNLKVIIRILDIYPDVLTSSNSFISNQIIYKTWALANRLIYPYADKIITLGDVMKEALSNYIKLSNIVTIPDWYTIDTTLVPKKEENPFRNELNLQNKTIVLYSGNIGLSHDLTPLIDAAEKLKKNDNLHFVIIGEGGGKESLIKRANQKKLSNVTFLPFQPLETLPISLSVGDIAVVSIKTESAKTLMPCKTYDYMAAKNAILGIVETDCDLSRIVKSEPKCGWIVNSDSKSLAELLSQIEIKKWAYERGKNAFEKVRKNFDAKQQLEKISYLLESTY